MYSRSSNRRPPINLPPDYSGTSLGPSQTNQSAAPRYISRFQRYDRPHSAITTENDRSAYKTQAITREDYNESAIPHRMMYEKDNLKPDGSRNVKHSPEYPPFGNNREDISTDSYPTGAAPDGDIRENGSAEPQERDEDYPYIPPLSSNSGGLGLLTGRELNTDDLLLAGLIFLLFEDTDPNQNSLETALIIAILFISGI